MNDLREQIVRIEVMQADLQLKKQSLRFGRWQIMIALMVAMAGLLGSSAAFMKLVLDKPYFLTVPHFYIPHVQSVL